ncbi:ATP-binding protein [Roseibium alexandrii]|uniref:ATP-binding protein n=1 Tax=Roseibium alexandrii TaxID=388408 RepID=UPI0037525C74
MDHLKPADMPAVLERTPLRATEENTLLPIYEAISNSIYATQSRWEKEVATQGKVKVEIKTTVFQATISDNGVGLNEVNYNHFLTPFTGFRLKKGGKGFGRFIAFKVFESIVYVSKYKEKGDTKHRSFGFDIFQTPQIRNPETSPPNLPYEVGCAVRYELPKISFQSVIDKLKPEDFVERIIRYFLPFFLSGDMPQIKITVDDADFDARAHFSDFFNSEIQKELEIDLGDERRDFQINISKVKKERLFKEHMVLLFADGRIIGSGRNISGKIGNSYFEAPDGSKQIYIASVSGKFLDERANTARTEIEATKEEIDAIVDEVTDIILSLELQFVKKHRFGQANRVASAIVRNPLLRSALNGKSISDYVSKKPMSWKAEDFVADLALQRFRGQSKWHEEFEAGLKTPQKLIEMRERITEQLDEENKDALASYVAHRRSVIELAEATLGLQDNGEMSLEDMFHDLVHPRYEDSDTTKFYQHNLWLLDEKLSFFSYCSSDRTIHGGRRKKGDKVADLVLFDDCSIYREGDNDTVVLIEFKRPGRNDYKYGNPKHDPVQQAISTAIQIRETGRIISKQGRTISVPTGVRLYAYVVADIEPTLRSICEDHDMHDSWDQKGYYLYHGKKDIFVEVLSYDKLLQDAKKRNAAFFDVLLGELVGDPSSQCN